MSYGHELTKTPKGIQLPKVRELQVARSVYSANDIMFVENKYVPDLLLRVYDHTLKFNGALSCTMKARRDLGYVATAKDRLAGR